MNRDVDADADVEAGRGWGKDRFARFRRTDVGAMRLILPCNGAEYVHNSEQIDISLVVIVDSVFIVGVAVVPIDPVNVRCVPVNTVTTCCQQIIIRCLL